MKQSKRLEPICDLNKRKEEEAAKELAKASQEVAAQKQRLIDLENYRNEYDKQFANAGGAGLTANQVRDYRRFLANLSAVVEQQRTAISNLELLFEEKKRQWLAARSRSKALDTVKVNYEKQEMHNEEKKLQNEIDDRGNRFVNR